MTVLPRPVCRDAGVLTSEPPLAPGYPGDLGEEYGHPLYAPAKGRFHTTGGDRLWIALAILLTFVLSYVLGSGRAFWEDEMLGWMLLTDPSWHHMVSAWKAGADGGGFFFYLSGRLWFAVFGASAVAFRFYSAACFGAALWVVWITMRRFYSTRIVAFALLNTWFFSPPIVTHMAEGRFYGLLMLGVSLATWLVVKADETMGTPTYVCVLMFLAHGLLTTSHLLGIVYSATLLVALIVLDRLRGLRSRLVLYLCAASTWLLLIPERAAISASAQVGKPHFWTTPPNLSKIIGAFTAYSVEVAAVLLLLGVGTLLSLRRETGGWKGVISSAWNERKPAYLVSAALLMVPIEFMLEGLVGPSLFVNRYLMPVAIAQCFLTAEALCVIQWDRFVPRGLIQSRQARRLLALGFGVVLLVWDFGHLSKAVPQQKNVTDKLTARLPKGVPVLCEDAWLFTEVIGQQHASGVQYTYLLDWSYAVSSDAPRLEVTQYHLMENWKKVGYFAGSIQYRDAFLRQNSRFLLLHEEPKVTLTEKPTIGNPLLERFSRDSAYEVMPYGDHKPPGTPNAWWVCRKSCGP